MRVPFYFGNSYETVQKSFFPVIPASAGMTGGGQE